MEENITRIFAGNIPFIRLHSCRSIFHNWCICLVSLNNCTLCIILNETPYPPIQIMHFFSAVGRAVKLRVAFFKFFNYVLCVTLPSRQSGTSCPPDFLFKDFFISLNRDVLPALLTWRRDCRFIASIQFPLCEPESEERVVVFIGNTTNNSWNLNSTSSITLVKSEIYSVSF